MSLCCLFGLQLRDSPFGNVADDIHAVVVVHVEQVTGQRADRHHHQLHGEGNTAHFPHLGLRRRRGVSGGDAQRKVSGERFVSNYEAAASKEWHNLTLFPLSYLFNYAPHSAASSWFLLKSAPRLFLLRTYKLHPSTPIVASLTRRLKIVQCWLHYQFKS